MDTEHKFLPSFGRKRGRALRKGKKDLLSTPLPEIIIDDPGEFPSILFASEPQIWLEIGFGYGEHLAHRAAHNPNITFIGCEVYEHGIANLLKLIKDNTLKNVRIFTKDARILISQLPESIVDRVFILFPDPWPKKRHNKRRIINKETVSIFSRIIKPGGVLNIATDWPDYTEWIMANMAAEGSFVFTAESKSDWVNPPNAHLMTKYERKACEENRSPVFMNFMKKYALI